MHRRLIFVLAMALAALLPAAAFATTVRPAGNTTITMTSVGGMSQASPNCGDSSGFFYQGPSTIANPALSEGMALEYVQFYPGPMRTILFDGIHVVINISENSALVLNVDFGQARCASATDAVLAGRWTGGTSVTYNPDTSALSCQDLAVTAGRYSGAVDFAAGTVTSTVTGSYKTVGTTYSCTLLS